MPAVFPTPTTRQVRRDDAGGRARGRLKPASGGQTQPQSPPGRGGGLRGIGGGTSSSPYAVWIRTFVLDDAPMAIRLYGRAICGSTEDQTFLIVLTKPAPFTTAKGRTSCRCCGGLARVAGAAARGGASPNVIVGNRKSSKPTAFASCRPPRRRLRTNRPERDRRGGRTAVSLHQTGAGPAGGAVCSAPKHDGSLPRRGQTKSPRAAMPGDGLASAEPLRRTMRPDVGNVAGLDALSRMQDVGHALLHLSTTMAYAMEAAARDQGRLLRARRTDPINASIVRARCSIPTSYVLNSLPMPGAPRMTLSPSWPACSMTEAARHHRT